MKAVKPKATHASDIKHNIDILSELTSKIDNLKERFDKIVSIPTEIKQLKSDPAQVHSDITTVQTHSTSTANKVDVMDEEVTWVVNDNRKLEKELEMCKDKLLKIEAHSRHDNLLIEGCKDKERENYAETENKVSNIIKDRVGIQDFDSKSIIRAHRLGQYKKNNKKPRDIIVKFHHYKTWEEIWGKRTSLKGSNIWLKEDYTREMVERWRVLFHIYKEAKRLGFDAKFNVDKLFLDKKLITTNILDELLPELRPKAINTPIINETVQAFFHEPSLLSNFYPAKIELNGQKFINSEQYLFYGKAEIAKDDDSIDQLQFFP